MQGQTKQKIYISKSYETFWLIFFISVYLVMQNYV